MQTPDFNRPIFAPVILGTSRQGRASEYAAHFVVDHVAKRPEIRTDLIDSRNIRLSIDDAGEAIKDPKFSKTVNYADALIFVVPEYNHSFPGLLKHVLDTNLKEYIHKAAGVCGVPPQHLLSSRFNASTVQRFNPSTSAKRRPVFLAIRSMSAIGIICHWNLAPPAATRFPLPIITAVIVLPHRRQFRRGPLMRNSCSK